MKIKFTVTLSDDTVAAFKREGATDTDGIIECCRDALGELFDTIREENPAEDEFDEDDES